MNKKKLLVGKMKRFKTFFVILVIVLFSGQMSLAQDYNLSIWDFSGPYTESGDDMTLSYTLIQDAKGKVTGSGTFNDQSDGNNLSIPVEIKGNVKGKNSIVTLKYKVKGKDAEGNKLKDKVSLELDESSLSLEGIDKIKICAKGAGCEKTEESVSHDVPDGMTGKAGLSIAAEPKESGKKLEGTGELTLSNGDIYNLSVKGKYNSKKDETKYKLKGVDTSTKGIKFKLKIDGQSDNATFIKGKAFGQQLELTATNLTICLFGDTQTCYCSDGTETEQACKTDGTGWEPCICTEYTIWDDPDTNLSWQDPQKDAYVHDYPGLTQPDALRYCDELVMGGYDNWRLPNIDELRTLVRGNPSSETDGACPVHEGSPKEDMEDPACVQAPDYEGPGSDGCYWVDELTGPCDRKDPADEGDRALETVSSTLASDDSFWVGDVLFDQGSVVFNHIYSLAEARCVRDGPASPNTCADETPDDCDPGETRQCTAPNGKTGAQSCAEDGLCWLPCDSTSFVPSPPAEDVSEQCDQVQLTLTVPVQFESPPQMLLAFLYKADSWAFPPARPPDGGTDYNQVLDPDIDLGKPLQMTVPACSYYRDRCIDAGEYYLYVGLLQSNEWPPWPAVPGDYSFGAVQVPLMLNDGPRQVIELEPLLDPYVE